MSRIDHHVALASVHGVWNPALISHLAEQAGASVRRRHLPASIAGSHVLLEDLFIDHWGRTARISSLGTFDLQVLIEASLKEPLDLLVLMLLPSEAARFDWPALAGGWQRLAWRGVANLLILSRAELDDDELAGLQAAGLNVSTLACGLRDHALAWEKIGAFLAAPELADPAARELAASDGDAAAKAGTPGGPPAFAGLVSQSWLDDDGSTSRARPGRPSAVQAYLEPLLHLMGAIEPDDRVEELIITCTTRTEVILHMPAEAGSGYTAAEFDRDEVSPAMARLLARDLAANALSNHA